MRGTLRWARADLRARRGQALLTIGVVGGVVAALFLASTLLQGALNPWQQLFARTHGADVLVFFQNGTDTSELGSLPGVQVSQPYQSRVSDAQAGRGALPRGAAQHDARSADDVDAADRRRNLAAVLGAERRRARGVVRGGRPRRRR